MPIELTWGRPRKDQTSKIEDNIKHGKAFALPAKPDDTFKTYTNEKSFHPSEPEDLENFRLAPIDKSKSGLWEQAWEQVKTMEEDWKLWPQFRDVKDLKAKDVVTEVQESAQRLRDQAEKSQRHVFGTSLTYRKMCSEVAKCAKKFEIVGDLVVQAEPVYSALPWTLVRFVIECAVGESDTWDSMLEGTEVVTTHISKYPVIEQLYGKIDSELSKGLRDSLLKFFVLILSFQMHTIKYFDPHRKGRRTASGINPVTADNIKKELQAIQKGKDRVDKDILLVDAEVTKRGIDNLKEGQEGQKEQLSAIKEGIKALSRNLDADFSEAERHQQERQKDLIEMWKGPLDEMKEAAENQRVGRETNYLLAVRSWLSVAMPWKNHRSAKDQRPMVLGKWLAHEPEFRNWQNSEQSSLLWLHGFAGTGKTGLVCRVIENLQETLKDAETGQESRRLAIFYCSNDKAKTGRQGTFSRADPEEALRSIISQLSTSEKDGYVAPVLREKFKTSGPGSDNQRPLDYADCVEVLGEISKFLPITIVLDAFDECDQDKSPILIKHLKEVIHRSPDRVKIFISTRSFPAIENSLKVDPSIAITAERNKEDVREFIKTTLDHRIKDKELLDGVVEPDLREKIRDTLTSRAQNMFLYASLLLNQLCDRNHTNDAESIRKKLDGLPENLVEMYSRIMAEIHDDKNNSQRSCRLAQDTFKWLLCAQNTENPLGYQSILEAISPPDRKADLDEVVAACRTLVKKEADTIKKVDTINFAHYSVREHVVQMEGYSPSQCNIVATHSCLRILNRIFGADESTRHQLSEPERSFADYALLYWPLHYEGIAQNDITEHRAAINAMLRSFLLIKARGDRHKYGVYERWFREAQKMAEPLKGNKYLASKLDALQANPPNPLFAACVFGLEDLIARFGRELNGLNKCNENGQNALCLAIENNKPEAVKALLSRRYPADLNLLNVSAVRQFDDWNPAAPPKVILYASALQCAAATGRLDIAKFLIEQGAHVDLVAGYYGSSLQAACLKGHGAIVELLLRKGATPNSQGGFHGNALQAAAAKGHSDIINVLLENKPPALVGTPGGHYGSALMAAVCSGSRDTVSVILDEEADPNFKDRVYGTPLEKAVSMGPAGKDVVEALVEYEAQADLSATGNGVHILHRAAMFGMNGLVKYCLNKECQIDIVTTKGPDYNPKARFNWFPSEMTPLAYACAEGHLDVITTLLEHGAPFEEHRRYSAPLWVAAYQGHADVVNLLITKFREEHNEEDTIAYMDHLPHPDAGRHFILYAAVSSCNADVVKVLLDHGAPYRSNWFGATPLHATASFGCAAVTRLLLDYHKDRRLDVCLDQRTRNGRTALFEACVGAKFDVASQLLDAGADLFIPNDQNRTTLQAACYYENYKFVEKLINKASEKTDEVGFLNFINQQPSSHKTALIECAENNRLQALKLLLEHKADYTLHGHLGNTPLLWASIKGHYEIAAALIEHAKLRDRESCPFKDFLSHKNKDDINALFIAIKSNYRSIVNLLLDEGIDWSITNKTGVSALHAASWRGYAEVVSALLAKAHKTANLEAFKKFLNGRNDQGKTALVEAAEIGQLEIVKELLEKYDADFLIPNNDRCSALNLACWFGHTEVASFLVRFASTNLSRERFMEFLNHRNKWGKTAFMDAAERNRPDIINLLLDHSADYSIRDNAGFTALHYCAFRNHTPALRTLLERASRDQTDEGGKFKRFLNQQSDNNRATALRDAASQKHTESAMLLLQHGPAYDLIDSKKRTALHHAVERPDGDFALALLEYARRDPDRGRFARFVNAKDEDGETVWAGAKRRCMPMLVQSLMACGVVEGA